MKKLQCAGMRRVKHADPPVPRRIMTTEAYALVADRASGWLAAHRNGQMRNGRSRHAPRFCRRKERRGVRP